MLKKFTTATLGLCLTLLVSAVAIPSPQESEGPRAKDQKEYEMVVAATKEQDAKKKIALLDAWTKDYPDTQLTKMRAQHYMAAYQGTGEATKAIEWAQKLLELSPGDFAATYVIALLTPATGSKEPATLAAGEKAAKALLGGMIDKQFATKPAQVPQAAWDAEKKKTVIFANQNLGWIEMTRENHKAAETYFKKVLELQPGNGQVSAWLGTVVFAQRDPDKNATALWSFARAAAYDGEGALPADNRTKVGEYLKDLYVKYTGTDSDLPDLLAKAKQSPLPPAGFEIASKAFREFEAEKKAREANPLRYNFLNLKALLTGPDGEKTWADLSGKLSPEMRLFVVSADPPARPQTINFSSEKGGPVEVVLNLENRLREGVGSGREITFEGVAAGLNKSPFRLTLNDGKLK